MHTHAHTPTTHTHPFTTQNQHTHTYTHTKTSPYTGLNLNWQSKMVSWRQIFVFSYSRLPGLSFSRWANNARLSQSWEILRPGFLLPTQSPTRAGSFSWLSSFRQRATFCTKSVFESNNDLISLFGFFSKIDTKQVLIRYKCRLLWLDIKIFGALLKAF